MMRMDDALDLFLQYIIAEKGLSPVTAKNYMDDLKQFLLYVKKDFVEELEADDLHLFLINQLGNGLSVSTALVTAASDVSADAIPALAPSATVAAYANTR